MMRFFVDFQNKTSNSSTVNNDSVGLAIGRVDTTLDGFARDDLAVKIHMVVTLAEFQGRSVLKCSLIVKNELLTVVCRKRNKSNLCVFHFFSISLFVDLFFKIEYTFAKSSNE